MSSPLQPTAALQLALKHHQAGQLMQAETIYRQILAANPKNFDALRLLAVVHAQRKELEPALRLLSEAIAIEPRHPVGHFNYANVLRDLGRSDEAIASYDKALALKPDYLEALNNRGNLLLDLKRFDEALASYDQALRSAGTHHGLLTNRGNALKALGRAEEALDAFEQALKVQPNYFEAAYNRANLLAAMERPDDAILAYDKVLQLKPDHIDALNNRGVALIKAARFEEALANFDRLLALRPNNAVYLNNRAHALVNLKRYDDAIASYNLALASGARSAEFDAAKLDALNNLGALLQSVGRREEALSCFEQALSATPERPSAWSNRGLLLLELDRHNEALSDFDQALRLNPDQAEAWNNRGLVLADLGRDEEALASYARALEVRPDYAKARFNAALSYLRVRDFERGWPAFESRLHGAFGDVQPPSSTPEWSGVAPLNGKTILLRTEWGLGDSLQFCRYAKLVKAAGAARVVIEVEKALVALFETLEGVDDVVEMGTALPRCDFSVSLMSLPRAFRTTLDTIPGDTPYLCADADKVRAWGEVLGQRTRPRVGLVWSGGFRPDQPELWAVNRRRNVPLAMLAPLAKANVDVFSLQKGDPAESELATLVAQGWNGPAIINHVSRLRDLSDTAALIENLDLVITVDTSAAHLSGALGKPVWILNRFDTCWRWMRERTDSPWYPTARLFRQTKLGDWTPVIEDVARALTDFAAQR